MNKVLITGATGFIGSHVAECFAEQGAEIKCLVRPQSNTAFLETLNVKLEYGDIDDEASILRALSDCDAIIHIAALSSDWGKASEFERVNVDGTINVLNAARKGQIQNIVITGSVSSYGEEHSTQIKDEQWPFNSHYPYFLDAIFPCKMNNYRDSKAKSTRVAMRFAEENGMNLVILEPAWVFGEREFSSGFYEYVKAVQDGSRIMPGSKKNRFHVIYAGDLAKAYYLAYQKKLKGVHRFILGNSTAQRQYKIFNEFCRQCGVDYPMNPPKWLLYPVGLLMEAWATLRQSKQPPLLTRARVNMFYDSIAYSVEKAKKELGFEPSYTLEEGIQKTVLWYKKNGYL